ncbi:sugar ABC transporter ATP-binding protein [Phytoactinopolyspora halotolerans]|uniref:Sugar ABC transporter ATP-binding protein n=1 Tax=Phytoactinopolyspora halotolerans TaxID=1981512 RepID=A0A6L9SFC5_9ACTN|nr:sugar ABC transporter ATP-binding protein [Phytoactinopolyspora halotolerans]NEE03354.1 sugar ABC transporter ATP-binding protein [Phytoactinopolyspora halotolerans]
MGTVHGSGSVEGGAPLVEVRGVSKRFGGTQALDDVSVSLAPGEVHAFVGENGAGKSTLGKVVAGLYSADSGRLLVGGREVQRWDPLRAQQAGVAMIAQELSLVPELTVAENVFLGVEEHRLGILRGTLAARFARLEDEVGFGLPPRARVRELRLADQQKVEIMRSLARDARVIVMDEPTSSLTTHETQRLHRLIQHLKAQDRTIVYVSHFLDAVFEVSDTISIMRDGRLVRSAPAMQETKRSVVEGMLGRRLDATFPPRPATVSAEVAPILQVSDLASERGARGASLAVRPGEIVGLLGLVGSGRTEIARAIFGADRVTGGDVCFDGERITGKRPRDAISRGMVFVPEDRHHQGLVLDRSVKENVSLAFLDRFSRHGIIATRDERHAVTDMVQSLQMRPPAIDLPVAGFSGGNQQKALLSKWLIGQPRLVILDEPTRGVDIGAKFTIYEAITALARRGVAVLLISSEHEEVLNLSHRAYLVIDGRTRGEVDPSSTPADEVLFQLFSVADTTLKEQPA